MTPISYLAGSVIFLTCFVVFKFLSWMTSKERPLIKLNYSLLSTNSLLYLVVALGSVTIIRQWQEIDIMQIRMEILEEENLLKCPAPLFKNQAPLNPHHNNQLPEIFFKERPKEIWL